jgi:hypothetical protein
MNLFFISCNNNDDSVFENEKTEATLNEELKFVYKDTKYYSECILLNDSFIILNDDVKKVYDELMKNENLATLIGKEEFYFFDNYEEMVAEYGLKSTSELRSSITYNWTVQLYVDEYYRADVEAYSGNGDFTCNYVRLNNTASSLKMTTSSNSTTICYITFFDNANCGKDGGQTLIYPLYQNDFTHEPDLVMVGRAWGWRDWSDKISSFTVRWK